jgi:DNA-binding XRE family transcriptional regulator
MSFRKKLMELREQSGMSQGQLAKAAGLSQAAISDLEQGRRQPAWETVRKLCRAMQVPCTEFDSDDEDADEPNRGRGRPPKPASDEPAEPKKPRGRQKKEG